jgi:hypothetical protein
MIGVSVPAKIRKGHESGQEQKQQRTSSQASQAMDCWILSVSCWTVDVCCKHGKPFSGHQNPSRPQTRVEGGRGLGGWSHTWSGQPTCPCQQLSAIPR